MLKTEKKRIGNCTYTCTQLSATRAIQIQFKFAKLLADPIQNIYNSISDEKGDGIKGIADLLKNIDNPDFFPLFIELIETCFRIPDGAQGERILFDRDFEGKLLEAWEVFIFAFMTNFKDFLSAAVGLFQGSGLIQKITQG